jgi:hypothetical protein
MCETFRIKQESGAFEIHAGAGAAAPKNGSNVFSSLAFSIYSGGVVKRKPICHEGVGKRRPGVVKYVFCLLAVFKR